MTQVTATLPCTQSSWNWSFTPTNDSVALTFPLTELPTPLNNDISVQVTAAGVNVIPGR